MKIDVDLVEWEASGCAMVDIRLPHKRKGWYYRIMHWFDKRDKAGDGKPTDDMTVVYQEIDAKGKIKILKKQEFGFETYWSQ